MANKRKKPDSVDCPYCRELTHKPNVTEDHVIARRWFPDSTPQTIKRWTVYACAECNNRKSHLEQCMFVRIAACVDPRLPGAAGIWDRAKRSIDARSVSDPIEKEKRQRVRDSIAKSMFEIDGVPVEGALPSFLSNYEAGSNAAIRISAADLDGLVKLWALGIHQVIWGEPAKRDAAIEVFHVDEAAAAVAFREIDGRWKSLYGGPGIQIDVAPGMDQSERSTIYAFAIWGQFRTYAAIQEKGL